MKYDVETFIRLSQIQAWDISDIKNESNKSKYADWEFKTTEKLMIDGINIEAEIETVVFQVTMEINR